MTINEDIYNALLGAGLPVASVTTDNAVIWQTGEPMTMAQMQQASDIIMQYANPVAYAEIVATLSRYNAAKSSAKAIPQYANWSIADWTSWRNLNISENQINGMGSLADAKPILVKMSNVLDGLAKLVIALRDRNFPDLPEWSE